MTQCLDDSPPIALDVARGVTRLLARSATYVMCEVPLPNHRRADLMGLEKKGGIVIVEIKVSKADLTSDAKWRDYLDYCDRFYWAVPPDLAAICDSEDYLPERAGLIVADRYDAAIAREATEIKLAAARRKAETLRLARRGALRLASQLDPALGEGH
ncbi:MmcB family DNA repair protein [Sphingomicrobium clamense]|uniref:MmcB family DNA repair protein n=1 Tax=Sphingomicrobium clamense TaxID=2851013 RepID=A0ABS6V309_9SPHN|nr:MmcB family DNA repair protein [Sphingomicrobium sp. B8]MBW0143926.1 MmcB family DNA repair protein [Sphingomicrobium sp. B8]